MLLPNMVFLALATSASASLFAIPDSLDISHLVRRKGSSSTTSSAASSTPTTTSSGSSGSCPSHWQTISQDLNKAFLETDGTCNALARASIRYAFHDAGTFSLKLPFTAPAGGGADGSLLLNPTEIGRGENGGLETYHNFITNKLSSYRSQFPGATVGAADLIQFASNVATITCPLGPKVKTVIGRNDSTTASPTNVMPPGFGPGSDHNSLLQLFQDKGFSAKDLAALIGAHTCSTAFKQAANGIPVNGRQDSTPGTWDVNYYAETYSPPQNVFRFDSDINLSKKDTAVGKEFSGFVGGQGKWSSAFADAMFRLSILGIPSGDSSKFVDCTGFLPKGTSSKMIRAMPINDRKH